MQGKRLSLRPFPPPAKPVFPQPRKGQRHALPWRHPPPGNSCSPFIALAHRLPRVVCSTVEMPQAKRLRASSSLVAWAWGGSLGRVGSRRRWKMHSKEACTARCCAGKRGGGHDSLQHSELQPPVPGPPEWMHAH